MTDVAQYFSDPLDPARSLQLNSRHWKGETFHNLDILREAEYDAANRRLASLRRSLRPVKALLPAHLHRSFIRRLVYSMVYWVSFEPIRFSLKLSREFIRANLYNGPDSEATKSATHTEELKYIVDLIHKIYRDQYGLDFVTSKFSVRYMNAANSKAASRMTAYGEFSDFHLDEGKDFTCILYLCSVQSSDQGCFSYLDGTPLVRKSHILRAFHQIVDFDMGLSASAPSERSHLPLEMRGSMAIGNYIDDEKRDKLRAACVDVLGNAGDGIIFNGFDTIHRGGKPVVGERTALFISSLGHLNLRLRKAMYDQLAYLWL
jgi:hypothetical protein